MDNRGSLERRDLWTGSEPARHSGRVGFVRGDCKSSCQKRGRLFARSRSGRLAVCALGAVFIPLLGAGVLHPSDKLTEDERIGLVRDLTAEYANAKVAIPRSKKPLEYNADGSYDHMAWHDGALTMGQAARLGD